MLRKTIKYFYLSSFMFLLLPFFISVIASACSSNDDCDSCEVCTDSVCTPVICSPCYKCDGAHGCEESSPEGTKCGTTDCDYLDTTCRDYHDVNSTCDGAGNCVAGTCNSYTNTTASCGTETRSCTAGTNCYCSGYKRYCDTDTDKSCTRYCSGGSCGSCSPPACSVSHQGTDADSDGYDQGCGDCDDGNSLVYLGSPNKFCDCNATTPAGNPSTKGISELTNCELDETGRKFTSGCLCLDGKDNDCDGKIDFADSDCPDLDKDWVIDGVGVTLTESKTMDGGVWVIDNGSLTIASGKTLSIDKDRGLHVESGGSIKFGSTSSKIKFH